MGPGGKGGKEEGGKEEGGKEEGAPSQGGKGAYELPQHHACPHDDLRAFEAP